jgi:hypothetical protein
MKTVTINTYKFSELSEKAKEKAICDHIGFEIEIMDASSPYYKYALEMEKMQTPWFLGEVIYEKAKQTIIATIEINDYNFTEDGKMY